MSVLGFDRFDGFDRCAFNGFGGFVGSPLSSRTVLHPPSLIVAASLLAARLAAGVCVRVPRSTSALARLVPASGALRSLASRTSFGRALAFGMATRRPRCRKVCREEANQPAAARGGMNRRTRRTRERAPVEPVEPVEP